MRSRMMAAFPPLGSARAGTTIPRLNPSPTTRPTVERPMVFMPIDFIIFTSFLLPRRYALLPPLRPTLLGYLHLPWLLHLPEQQTLPTPLIQSWPFFQQSQ